MKQIIRNLLPSIIFASKEKLPIIVDIVIKDLHYIILEKFSKKFTNVLSITYPNAQRSNNQPALNSNETDNQKSLQKL